MKELGPVVNHHFDALPGVIKQLASLLINGDDISGVPSLIYRTFLEAPDALDRSLRVQDPFSLVRTNRQIHGELTEHLFRTGKFVLVVISAVFQVDLDSIRLDSVSHLLSLQSGQAESR
jgi:hypothetical protein